MDRRGSTRILERYFVTILGSTGTQRGMTEAQRRGFIDVIDKLGDRNEFHHGDCVGADSEAHETAYSHECGIHIHPPINPSKRAFCDKGIRRGDRPVIIYDPLPYLARNQIIVDAAEHLIAAPAAPEDHPSSRRSGTWYTVRRARLKGIPITIIWPDGHVEENRP